MLLVGAIEKWYRRLQDGSADTEQTSYPLISIASLIFLMELRALLSSTNLKI